LRFKKRSLGSFGVFFFKFSLLIVGVIIRFAVSFDKKTPEKPLRFPGVQMIQKCVSADRSGHNYPKIIV